MLDDKAFIKDLLAPAEIALNHPRPVIALDMPSKSIYSNTVSQVHLYFFLLAEYPFPHLLIT